MIEYMMSQPTMEPSLPRRQKFHTRKAPGVPTARLNGRDTDQPNSAAGTAPESWQAASL